MPQESVSSHSLSQPPCQVLPPLRQTSTPSMKFGVVVVRHPQTLKDSAFKEPDHYANRPNAVGVVVSDPPFTPQIVYRGKGGVSSTES